MAASTRGMSRGEGIGGEESQQPWGEGGPLHTKLAGGAKREQEGGSDTPPQILTGPVRRRKRKMQSRTAAAVARKRTRAGKPARPKFWDRRGLESGAGCRRTGSQTDEECSSPIPAASKGPGAREISRPEDDRTQCRVYFPGIAADHGDNAIAVPARTRSAARSEARSRAKIIFRPRRCQSHSSELKSDAGAAAIDVKDCLIGIAKN